MQRHNVPFEHVDAWVPSFVPNNTPGDGADAGGEPKCWLCYAGSATTDVQVDASGRGPAHVMSQEEHFNLLAFGPSVHLNLLGNIHLLL